MLTLRRILACDITTNKILTDWPPNYHETSRMFPQIFCISHSMNKMTLNEPVILSMTSQSRKILGSCVLGKEFLKDKVC